MSSSLPSPSTSQPPVPARPAGDDGPDAGPRGDVWIVGQRDREQRLGVLIPDVQLLPPVAVDVRQQQVVGPVRGQPEHVSADPPLAGIGRALPPVDAIAAIAGAGDQVEPAITGEVHKGAADADAGECVIDQVRFPGATACSAEPMKLIRIAGGDNEFGHTGAVKIANDTRHAFGGRTLVDGMAAKNRQLRHLANLQFVKVTNDTRFA